MSDIYQPSDIITTTNLDPSDKVAEIKGKGSNDKGTNNIEDKLNSIVGYSHPLELVKISKKIPSRHPF
jgi:hypothetical protein